MVTELYLWLVVVILLVILMIGQIVLLTKLLMEGINS